MSWKLTIGLTLFLVLVLAFFVWNDPRFAQKYRACQEPIIYSIGSFDQRFGVSQENFLNALVQAEAIWEDALDKELFSYQSEGGELSVNLIYDYRQETTKTLSSLGETLEENEVLYDTLKGQYDNLRIEYEDLLNLYKVKVTSFDKNNEAYRRQVEAWNRGSRTSQSQFNKLEEQRIALEAEIRDLNVLEADLNSKAGEINSLADRLNHLAQVLNLNVEKFNTIGASRGESFTGGIYSQIKGEQNIDIYEFSSYDKLVRILAHELGHALGLEHNNDPEAIMYYLNESEAQVLSPADLAALQALCYN